jgi:hypothetical protein
MSGLASALNLDDHLVRPAIAFDPLWAAVELADRLGLSPDEMDDVVNGIAQAAEAESQRQARIAAGVEHACVVCGCSESRGSPGGCVWAKPNLCSRCASAAREAFP